MTSHTPHFARIIAIDGPAGAGKSTVARTLANRLGYVLLDTGALYRSIALAAMKADVSFDDPEAVAAIARGIAERSELTLEPSDTAHNGVRVVLSGEDVSKLIREPNISMGASTVSAIPGVRDALLELQRSLATRPGARGTVAEGRDIGTVVFPNAHVKFFLTASLEIRSRRRQDELDAKGSSQTFAETMEEVAKRDKQDTERAAAPLRQADDALRVDSSDRSIDDVVSEMLQAVERATTA
jgi:cytidylate kinase